MKDNFSTEQHKKAKPLVARRETIALRVSDAVRDLPGLTPPMVREGCRHVFYHWGARYDEVVTGVSRDTVVKALAAEGAPVWQGYVAPLYLLPAFQRRLAIGRDGFPFTLTERSYDHGICPVAERYHERELLELAVCSYELDDADVNDVITAFDKVFDNLPALSNLAAGEQA